MPSEKRDPFDILIEDHNEMYEYHDKLKGANSITEKFQWLDKIHWEIARHAAAEERALYPLIREHLDKGDFLVEVALLQHQTIKDSFASFEQFSKLDEDKIDKELLEKTIDTFMEDLKTHNDEEEELQFPKLREKLNQKELDDLAEALTSAKKQAPTHVHPYAPTRNQTILSVVQPIQGAIDKATDYITGRPRDGLTSPAE
jgi:hemerythrin superfamily protein